MDAYANRKPYADHPDRGVRDQAHATAAEVFVDDVRQDEDDGPDQHAGSEAERPLLAEQVPAEGRQAERLFERKDLDADELGDDGVADEECGQQDEEPRRARPEQGHRHRRIPSSVPGICASAGSLHRRACLASAQEPLLTRLRSGAGAASRARPLPSRSPRPLPAARAVPRLARRCGSAPRTPSPRQCARRSAQVCGS